MLTIQQLEQRKSGIGGSDAAAICGVSKWRTPLYIYLTKTTDIIPVIENPIFERGHILEPLIKELFVRQFKKEVKTDIPTIRCNEFSYMMANLDGIIESENAVVEFKHYNKFMEKDWGEDYTDQVPEDYLLQVQHYLSVTKLKKAYIVPFFSNQETFQLIYSFILKEGVKRFFDVFDYQSFPLRIFEIFPNETLFKPLRQIEGDFWHKHVEKNVPPSWKTKEDLAHLFPVAEDKSIIANYEDMKILSEINQKNTVIETLEKEIEEKKLKLCAKLKESSFLKSPEGQILATWKNQDRISLDSKALLKEYPEIGSKFQTKKTMRVLRIGK